MLHDLRYAGLVNLVVNGRHLEIFIIFPFTDVT